MAPSHPDPQTTSPPAVKMVCSCCISPHFVLGQCTHPKNLYRELPSTTATALKKAATDEEFVNLLPPWIRHTNRAPALSQPRDGYTLMVIDVRRPRPLTWSWDGLASEFKSVVQGHMISSYILNVHPPIGVVYTACLHDPMPLPNDANGNARETCQHRYLVEVSLEVARTLAVDIEVRKCFDVTTSRRGSWGMTYRMLTADLPRIHQFPELVNKSIANTTMQPAAPNVASQSPTAASAPDARASSVGKKRSQAELEEENRPNKRHRAQASRKGKEKAMSPMPGSAMDLDVSDTESNIPLADLAARRAASDSAQSLPTPPHSAGSYVSRFNTSAPPNGSQPDPNPPSSSSISMPLSSVRSPVVPHPAPIFVRPFVRPDQPAPGPSYESWPIENTASPEAIREEANKGNEPSPTSTFVPPSILKREGSKDLSDPVRRQPRTVSFLSPVKQHDTKDDMKTLYSNYTRRVTHPAPTPPPGNPTYVRGWTHPELTPPAATRELAPELGGGYNQASQPTPPPNMGPVPVHPPPQARAPTSPLSDRSATAMDANTHRRNAVPEDVPMAEAQPDPSHPAPIAPANYQFTFEMPSSGPAGVRQWAPTYFPDPKLGGVPMSEQWPARVAHLRSGWNVNSTWRQPHSYRPGGINPAVDPSVLSQQFSQVRI
ncbi:hypothetical protein CALVIDRAFT_529907 [Calocera viscosa TUFC12733]|uniref:Uncharacterized protein n=1 Tax=Calocera viscosa (strain TUFC12733) TaxID=1330018 RepID=A0A167ILP1_CALVF|nr:hypothetical protein CALVIDRAFT_529907 [Calocera viscosa TUFC12733]